MLVAEISTGYQKVHIYYEDDPLCTSSYIIYLWLHISHFEYVLSIHSGNNGHVLKIFIKI